MLQEDKRLDNFIDICKSKGLKLTHQRLQIFKELLDATDHPSVDTLYHRIKPKMPTISIDTVYRTLMTFEDCGLVRRLDTHQSQARFDARLHTHHHLICNNCGKIEDFCWEEFDALKPPQELSQTVKIHSKTVTLHGLCKDCASSSTD